MYQISRTHLIGYLVEDGITSSVHAKNTFSRTSIMLRIRTLCDVRRTCDELVVYAVNSNEIYANASNPDVFRQGEENKSDK